MTTRLEYQPSRFCFGAVLLDARRRRVFRNGAEVRLTLKEYELLLALARNAGRPIPYDELRETVWNNSIQPTSRTIAQHVLELRKKLEDDPSHPTCIRTQNKFGYVMEGGWIETPIEP